MPPRTSKRFVPRKDYGRACEAWYDDSFPWRTELLRFHRKFAFDRLKIPSGRDVPGRGKWIFRRGGDWPELDDFLGAFELPPDKIQAWLDLFEGRREWARAIGSVYLAMPTPVKARIRWQEMYPALRKHRGRSVVDQIREALETSPAKDDVLFADEDFEAAFAAGREVFFDSDHHPDAYGLWLLYDRVNRRLAELFPDRVRAPFPWYDDPPPEVLAGEAPGCWLERGGDGLRLDVSSPGETEDDDGVVHNGSRFPYTNVATVREGGGLAVLMAHDSYMRFTLSSWRRPDGSVRFPFAEGVGRGALVAGRALGGAEQEERLRAEARRGGVLREVGEEAARLGGVERRALDRAEAGQREAAVGGHRALGKVLEERLEPRGGVRVAAEPLECGGVVVERQLADLGLGAGGEELREELLRGLVLPHLGEEGGALEHRLAAPGGVGGVDRALVGLERLDPVAGAAVRLAEAEARQRVVGALRELVEEAGVLDGGLAVEAAGEERVGEGAAVLLRARVGVGEGGGRERGEEGEGGKNAFHGARF